MPLQLSVFISRSREADPDNRMLEDSIAAALAAESGIHVQLVPSLYDLRSDSDPVRAMRSASGERIVLSWMYERATRWVLHWLEVTDASEIRAIQGDPNSSDSVQSDVRCLDLKSHGDPAPFVAAIRQWARTAQQGPVSRSAKSADPIAIGQDAVPRRRWYPVIDYSRCTNCMECIDFCLFGVYGVDDAERILVEQPDQCRKGCPACSRVCPEQAIMFPLHKMPAIAGAAGGIAPLKLDLSHLFGGPAASDDAKSLALSERERHARAAPRGAAEENLRPLTQPSPPRFHRAGEGEGTIESAARPGEKDAAPDELDHLLDALDEFDASM